MFAPADNPNWFANSPLTRANVEVDIDDRIDAFARSADALFIPLWRGDPLVAGGAAGFLDMAARAEIAAAPLAYLGEAQGRHHFAADVSALAETADAAPFTDIGAYAPLREAAGILAKDDLAMIGHARWLFEWRRKYGFCARCGTAVRFTQGGAKSACPACGAEHFPRVSPVAIILALHDDACFLGRSPHFPPGFLSALAGFVEAGETPEEAAVRELREEAGLTIDRLAYQFSQPWPFPCSLMMGFFAEARSRDFALDEREIVEGRWVEREHARRLLDGARDAALRLPPAFTIAGQLIRRWAEPRD